MRSFKHLLIRCPEEEVAFRADNVFARYAETYRIVEVRQIEVGLYDLVIEKCKYKVEDGETKEQCQGHDSM